MTSGPPTLVRSDYIEIVSLFLLCLFGIPLNLLSLDRHSKRLSKLRKQPIHKSFTLLTLNLNLTDLLIMLYTIGKIGWIWTYEWKGGLVLCKFFKYFSSFCFYLNSNSILAIAFERVRAVVFPITARNGGTGFATGAIVVSWVVASLSSVPQLWIWETLDVGSSFQANISWVQCTDIFTVKRHYFVNLTTVEANLEVGYAVAQLLLLFWVPLLLLIASYSTIAVRVAPCWCVPNLKRNSTTTSYLASQQPKDAIPVVKVETCEQGKNKGDRHHILLSTGKSEAKTTFSSSEEPITHSSVIDFTNESTSARTQIGSDGSQSEARLTRVYKNIKGRRIFRRAALIVLTHAMLWAPYNAYSIISFTDPGLVAQFTDSAHFLLSLIVLNAVLNPFLYNT